MEQIFYLYQPASRSVIYRLCSVFSGSWLVEKITNIKIINNITKLNQSLPLLTDTLENQYPEDSISKPSCSNSLKQPFFFRFCPKSVFFFIAYFKKIVLNFYIFHPVGSLFRAQMAKKNIMNFISFQFTCTRCIFSGSLIIILKDFPLSPGSCLNTFKLYLPTVSVIAGGRLPTKQSPPEQFVHPTDRPTGLGRSLQNQSQELLKTIETGFLNKFIWLMDPQSTMFFNIRIAPESPLNGKPSI